MALTKFNCCQCPEPPDYDAEVDDPLPRYRNKCGCPEATVICESVEKNATLCGFPEYTDAAADPPIEASVPPKKYRKTSMFGRNESEGNDCVCDTLLISSEEDFSGTVAREYDLNLTPCEFTTDPPIEGTTFFYYYDTDDPCTPILTSTTEQFDSIQFSENPLSSSTTKINSSTSAINVWERINNFPSSHDCAGQLSSYIRTIREYSLSEEDEEADALARATETEGTNCTSIYELRTTSFSFTVRTVKFSLELTNLCYGRAYEGCVRIRKRKAFSGTVPDGEVVEWEDVEPFTFGPITPTSANTEDGVTTTAEITDQDLVGGTEDARGWEYEILSAHVWPVSVGCDCPTELGYTDPE